MSNNLFSRKDPLVDAVKGVMAVNEKERAAKEAALKEFNVTDRKALPHEMQGAFDATYNKKLLGESSHEKEYGVDGERERAAKGERFGKKKKSMGDRIKAFNDKAKANGGPKGPVRVAEEEQLDELSKDTLKSYIKKAPKSMRDMYQDDDKWSNKKFDNRSKGLQKALEKRDMKEEEQLDELSKDTLKSYISKAAISAQNHGYHSGRAKDMKDYAKHAVKGIKRRKGIDKAVDKMDKKHQKTKSDAGWDYENNRHNYDNGRDGWMEEETVVEGKWNYPKELTKTREVDDMGGTNQASNRKRRKELRKKIKATAHKNLMTKKVNEETVVEALKIRKGIDKTHVVDSKGNVVKTFDYHGHSSKHEDRARDFIKIMKKYAPGKVEVPPEPKEKPKAKKKVVAEAQLNELSKNTLKSYIKKATIDRGSRLFNAGKESASPTPLKTPYNNKKRNKAWQKIDNRGLGVVKAAGKLAKEEVQLAEMGAGNPTVVKKDTNTPPAQAGKAVPRPDQSGNALNKLKSIMPKTATDINREHRAKTGQNIQISPKAAPGPSALRPKVATRPEGKAAGLPAANPTLGATARNDSGPDSAKREKPNIPPASATAKAPAPQAAATKQSVTAKVRNKVSPTRTAPAGSGVSDAVKKSVSRDVAAGRYQKDARPDKIAQMRQNAVNKAAARKQAFQASRKPMGNPFKK